MPAPGSASGLRKAAILMMAVGDELAKVFFESLSHANVRLLINEVAQLGEVPGVELTQVLTEFYGLLATEQYSLRGGPEHASRLLAQAFGPERAAQMLQEVEGMRRTRDDLHMLQKLDPQQLSKFLAGEHPQTVALVLAHMDGKRGSALLMHLDPKLRIETVRRLAEMRQFSPEMAQKVGAILHKRMESMGTAGRKSYAGFRAVADLMNRLDTPASKSILDEIERDEPKLAIGIRNQMFTFDDLLTVPEASVREIVSVADKRVLAMALKGAREDLCAHLFKAMSTRAVEMLKDDMESMGPLRSKEINGAQQEILTVANSLEAEGRVTLKIEADDELDG
jgi:flagellar motor switch protein FliG